jgi:uncharacterized protein involved in outer membrane biogenesis
MNKPSRGFLIGTGILAATLLIAVASIALFLDVDRYKGPIEAAVSASLGMDFKIRGRASLRLFPRPRLSLPDIHLSNGANEILSAEELQASPRWIRLLLHREVLLNRVLLRSPKIRIEKNGQGHMNYEGAVQADTAQRDQASRPGAMSLLSVEHGDVTYVDRGAGRTIELGNLGLTLTDISWGQSAARDPLAFLKSVSLRGTVDGATLQIGRFKASDGKSGLKVEAGLVQLDPTAITLFGGSSRGSVTLDVRGPAPRIHVVQAASQIDLTQAFPVQIFFGKVQASLDVQGTGHDQRAITATLTGPVSIRSEHISINSLDVDGLVADYNRTQNFSLIDLGSLIIAGPFAPLLSKGVDFSRLRFFGQMGHGKSEIRRVVSDWQIVQGIARTKDVAFTTPKNTVAFRGDLDLVHRSYQHFFVATVDQHGCAQVKQQITGPFAHPDDGGSASTGLGAFKSAFRKAKGLFQSHPCDLFYSGSAIQ